MPVQLKKIGKPDSLYVQAMHAIKEAIFRKDYKTGRPLPSETELAIQLGVSRPVVREALRVLQMQGFLDIRRGNRGGAYVTDLHNISFQDNLEDLLRLRRVSVNDLAQARFLLEPEVHKLAAENITPEEIAELQEIVDRTIHCKSNEERVKLNVDFHRIIARASGNTFYTILLDTLLDFTESFIRTTKPEGLNVQGHMGHQEILDALAEGDAPLAARLSREHISGMAKMMADLESVWLRKTQE